MFGETSPRQLVASVSPVICLLLYSLMSHYLRGATCTLCQKTHKAVLTARSTQSKSCRRECVHVAELDV